MRQTVRRLLRLTQVLLVSYFFSPRVCHILEHFACPPSLPIQCGVVYGTAGLFFGPRDFTPHSEPVEERDLCYRVKRANASRSGTSQNPQTPTPNQHQSQKHKSHVL